MYIIRLNKCKLEGVKQFFQTLVEFREKEQKSDYMAKMAC